MTDATEILVHWADLHRWAGSPHGVDAIVPRTHVSRESAAVRDGWYQRILGRLERTPADAEASLFHSPHDGI